MRIIQRIETNYFRSIYSLSLKSCKDVNILVGGNDAGKSNVLKALNLFFNNETELSVPFSFYDDLSRLRSEEARASKGRSTIWIKVTFINYENWSSLPDQFTIKKVWSRYSLQPEITWPDEISNTVMGRFMNKISFHYIPAVRSREIFSHYLRLLHDSLFLEERGGIDEASFDLMRSINDRTTSMSEKIKDRLGFDSNIAAPQDLKDLFSALDFNTKFNEFNIPLQKRGDGIQARHIPFILQFIASNSKKNHIWGYEEPENSLEMGRAFDLAEQFNSEFSSENQIFLTTHSPAFYDLQGGGVKKWLIENRENQGGNDSQTGASEINDSNETDNSLGVAALIARRASELHDQLEEERVRSKELRSELKEITVPQVVVEGVTDQIILEAAASNYYDEEPPFVVRPANNADNVIKYLQSTSRLSHDFAVPLIGVLDNDYAGNKAFKELKHKHFKEGTNFKEIKGGKDIFARLLPTPSWVEDAQKDLKKGVNYSEELPVTIESLLHPECMYRAFRAGVIEFESIEASAKNHNYNLMINLSDYLADHLEDNRRYLVYTLSDSCKRRFSEWVSENAGSEDFEAIFDLIKEIDEIISNIE